MLNASNNNFETGINLQEVNKNKVNSQMSKKEEVPTIVVSDDVEINPTLDDIPVWESAYEERKKSTNVKFESLDNLSAHKIWGIVLVRLREEHYMMLHTAGGEIRDIKLVGDKLIAKVKQRNLYSIMTENENFNKISLELKKINDKLTIEFVLDLPKESEGLKNLPKVKKLFGEFLKTNQ